MENQNDLARPRYKLADLLSEESVLEILGCKKEALSTYRRELQLPFLQVTTRKRLYLEDDLVTWLLGRRKVLGIADSEERLKTHAGTP